MIPVTFTCGHTCDLKGDETTALCTMCGCAAIERVMAPAPTFRGHARGPCSVYEPLQPMAVSFGEKEDSHG